MPCGKGVKSKSTGPGRKWWRRTESSRPISRVLSWAAIHLGRPSPITSSGLPESSADHAEGFLFGLAPGGVYLAAGVAAERGALLPHPFTLTRRLPAGGLLSAALSVGSRPPGVTWRPVLWSPDFPSRLKRERDGCLAGSTAYHSTCARVGLAALAAGSTGCWVGLGGGKTRRPSGRRILWRQQTVGLGALAARSTGCWVGLGGGKTRRPSGRRILWH